MFFTNFIPVKSIKSFLKINTTMKKLLMLFALVAFVGIGTANAQVKTETKKECAKTCTAAKEGTAMKAEVKEAPAKATSATAEVETEKKACSSTKAEGAACCSKDKAKGTAMKASVKDAPAKASGEAAAKKECSKKGSSCCSKAKATEKEEQ
ncbi:MAG: hypothetical protein HC803_04060 [Saprospiraceae bacterium]|nr:hypothetical protein [Saprospiraceae bacterium]